MYRLSKSESDDKVSMFVGMDLHKNYLQIAVMNEEGRVLRNSKIDNNLRQISRFFDVVNNDKAPRFFIDLSQLRHDNVESLGFIC